MEYSSAQLGKNESMIVSNSFPQDDTMSVVKPKYPELTTSSHQEKPSIQLLFSLKDKKSILFAGGLIISIFLMIVFIYIGRRSMMVASIRKALSEDVALSRQLSGNRPITECDAKIIQTYAQGLRRIDMSRCPRDFQLAYLDHIHAWESLARSRASFDLLGFVIESYLRKTIPTIPDEKPIHNEITKTWDKIERIAISYGVRVPE
jgi:hypothetical protein